MSRSVGCGSIPGRSGTCPTCLGNEKYAALGGSACPSLLVFGGRFVGVVDDEEIDIFPGGFELEAELFL